MKEQEDRQKNGGDPNEGDGELDLDLYTIGDSAQYLNNIVLSDSTL